MGKAGSPALVDVQVILDLRIAPVGEIFGMIIDLKQISMQKHSKKDAYRVESIPAHQSDCIRQHRTTDGVPRAYADTWRHRFLSIFGYEARVQLDKIGMFVEMSKLIRNSLMTSKRVGAILPGNHQRTSSGLISSNVS